MNTYFRTAWRNLLANKTYSLINIIGLSVSLAACILLLLWVQDELSFDGFHKKADRIYKASAMFSKEGKTDIWTTPAPLATKGKQEVPEIADACRVTGLWEINKLQYKDKKYFDLQCGLADRSFFTMFSFTLLEGNAKNPFPDNQSVVISESTAKKFFGEENPIGKIIQGNDRERFQVTGIMKDIPANSSIRFDLIVPFTILEREYDGKGYWKSLDENWGNYNYDTYFLLKENTNAAAAAKKLTSLHQKAQPGNFTRNLNYVLQPLEKVHLYSADGKDQDMATVRIFFIIAMVILLIACINYVNLITARAIRRAKEISLRKIVGAGKGQLFLQFMSESLLLFLISMVTATILIFLIMPLYNSIAGKHMTFVLFSAEVWLTYLFTLVATLILAGIYPAVTLTAFKPIEALRGRLSGFGKNVTIRKGLVVLQFTLSVILIISTFVIGRQLKYIREKNLGFDKENIIMVNLHEIGNHYDAAKSELLSRPEIVDITSSGEDIMNSYSSTGDAEWDGKTAAHETFMINQNPVERNFLKVMNLKLVAGSGFTGTPADSSNFILNETAVKAMGISDPVGKRFKFHDQNGTIAGVVKDFHFQNLHNTIKPVILYYNPTWKNIMYIKTSTRNTSKAISALKKVWTQYNGDLPFKYKFLDDTFNEMYRADIRIGMLFNSFAIITILISCLGLFGLITFTAESRVKEIGIRKTLGAGISHIVGMLSKDFLILVLISCAISFPAAWWALNKLLQQYAYRTALSWEIFAIAGVLTLLIAMLTISFKAVKAALANPVKSLRTE